MPNTQSGAKRRRQDTKRNAHNRARVRVMKQAVRAVREAAASGNIAEAEQKLPAAYKAIDKAASHGPLHTNAAARHKKRLVRFMQKAQDAQ